MVLTYLKGLICREKKWLFCEKQAVSVCVCLNVENFYKYVMVPISSKVFYVDKSC